jgi:hypothetical protein
MAMYTIIKYVLAWFIGNIIFIIMGPMEKMLRYDNPMWDNMPTWMNAWGDQIYGIWVLFNVLMAATMIIAGITEANRSRSLEN